MILFPAILKGYRTKVDRSLTVIFETNELSPEKMGAIHSMLEKFGYVAFKGEDFKTEDKELLESLKADAIEDNTKTPSQQLRGVLFRNWEQSNEGYKLFSDYYRAKYEVLINHFKGKLD